MFYYFFIQSFSQLNNVYGDDVSQIILDNCGLIYLKTNTEDTENGLNKKKFNLKKLNCIDERNEINPVQTDTTDSNYVFDNEDAIVVNLKNKKNK